MKLYFKNLRKCFLKYSIISVTIFLPFFALAQSGAIRSAHEELIQSIDKLSEIKDPQLSLGGKTKKEIELKKLALEKILNLSILETEDLKAKLEILEDVEAEFAILEEDLLKKIGGFLDYFLVIQNVLAVTDDLVTIQKIAGDFKDWRETVYNPEIKKIVNFLLAFQNKSLLKIADQRFAKISLELKRARSLKLNPENWQPLLTEAALNLKDARSSNGQAMILLLGYGPTIQDAQSPTEQTSTSARQNNKQLSPTYDFATKDLIIRTFIETSLLNIKKAYQNFIELANLAKKSIK